LNIGRAEMLIGMFRSPHQLANTNEAYQYNSLATYCPFVGLDYASEKDPSAIGFSNKRPTYDVGGKYTFKSSLDNNSKGQFGYQLHVGNGQIPLQIIETTTEMLNEYEKSTYHLGRKHRKNSQNISLVTPTNNLNTLRHLNFDPFLNDGFFTPFVPVYALDDQTITGNPYFQCAEWATLAANNIQIRGRRCPTINENTGVLNKFTPPEGNFYLAWTFAPWSEEQSADMVRAGRSLHSALLRLEMKGCHMMNTTITTNASLNPINQNVLCDFIAKMYYRFAYVAGGGMTGFF